MNSIITAARVLVRGSARLQHRRFSVSIRSRCASSPKVSSIFCNSPIVLRNITMTLAVVTAAGSKSKVAHMSGKSSTSCQDRKRQAFLKKRAKEIVDEAFQVLREDRKDQIEYMSLLDMIQVTVKAYPEIYRCVEERLLIEEKEIRKGGAWKRVLSLLYRRKAVSQPVFLEHFRD